jgi:hypothetical protein
VKCYRPCCFVSRPGPELRLTQIDIRKLIRVGVWGPAVVPAQARATGSSADLWTLVLATEPLLVTRSNNLTRHVRETTARRIHIPPYNPVRSLDKE